MKNTSNTRKSSGKKGAGEVGCPTTYNYGKGGGKGRKNMSPTRATDSR